MTTCVLSSGMQFNVSSVELARILEGATVKRGKGNEVQSVYHVMPFAMKSQGNELTCIVSVYAEDDKYQFDKAVKRTQEAQS